MSEYDWEDDVKNSYLTGIAAKREQYLMDTITGLKRVKVFPDGGPPRPPVQEDMGL